MQRRDPNLRVPPWAHASALGLPAGSGDPGIAIGTDAALPRVRPWLHPPVLLGEEGFQGRQQATGRQAVGEGDASVNSGRRQAEELVH